MIIEVVGAVIHDADGRLLLVRKRGAERFMLPGGKPEPGEDDLTALARELREELGGELAAAEPLGRFAGPAANEPGATVRSSVYRVEISGELGASSEIEALLWIEPSTPPAVPLAPLLANEILPVLNGAR